MSTVPIAFGPVPSRRLGQSLGINHIPPKSCSYDCVYCQVGPTRAPAHDRRSFLAVDEVVDAVTTRVETLRAGGQAVDYLTFVPDGEPTLDLGLADAIRALRPLGIPIAVISNGSLVDRAEVREVLALADWVSLKVDAVRPATWRRINRPAPGLDLEAILAGMASFAAAFDGTLTTETMLVAGVNDNEEDLLATAEIVASLWPDVAYLGLPTRPPSEPWVEAPDEETVVRAWRLFTERIGVVELLSGYAEGAFGQTGDPAADLLATTAVHPMREEEVLGFVDGDRALVETMVADGRLRRVDHAGQVFYVHVPTGQHAV